MAPTRIVLQSALALALACSYSGLAGAQTPAAKPAPKAVTKPAKPSKKPAAKPAEFVQPAAGLEQIAAAERVYYGVYECEFNQKIDIVADPKHPAYVEVKHLKAAYLMKPVVSSTGAVRLEDVRGATLMVQISNKSMLLNVKTGQRVVDDCVSPTQREFITAAKLARAQGGDAASSPSMLSGAASVPSGAASAPLGAASAPSDAASAPSGAASAPSDAASAPSDAASAATR